MQRVNVNDIDIAYRIDGEDSKPWLIISNSLATDHRMWDQQMAILTKTNRVLRYDTRGHGQSNSSSGAYTFPLLVGDVIGLMDILDVKSADILGLSLGGMTGLGLALDYPERVNRLICCDARADSPESYAKGWRDRIEIVRRKGSSALVDATLERWFTDTFRSNPENVKIIESISAMIVETSVDGFCGCAAGLTTLNYAPRLMDIEAHCLFIVGEEDSAAPPEVMKSMAESVPKHDFVAIENAAHLSNLNNPTEFNKIIGHWLEFSHCNL